MDKVTAQKVIDELSLHYTDKPALNYKTEYQLLVAVILSAQCTDERVNKVTEKLFKDFPTPTAMLSLSEEELGKRIFSCGLYNSKAKHILSATRDIVQKFGGEVPSDLETLRSLAGVGRKTANVVYSVGFGKNAIAVDTHVFRVANRIGLAKATDVLGTEKQLMSILDENVWSKSHHYLIYHGRNVCKSQKPDCENCCINSVCEKNFKSKPVVKK
jgi:endonuclease-3